MPRKTRFKPKQVRKPPKCLFCERQKTPFFGDVDVLRQFTTDRGKIVNRKRSGVCAKHQRRLSRAIKRARHLALLPFVVQ